MAILARAKFAKRNLTRVTALFLVAFPNALALANESCPSQVASHFDYFDAVDRYRRGIDMLKASGRFKNSDNLPYVLEHGHRTRRVAVLVHGFTDSPASLRSIAQAYYEQGFNVVGVLLRGHGTDYRDLSQVSAADWKADVDAALAYASRMGDQVTVVGYSTGGTLAIDAARHNPGLIHDLVLVAPLLEHRSHVTAFADAISPLVPYSSKKGQIPPHAYRKISNHAVGETTQLVKDIQPVLHGEKLGVPILMIDTEAEATVGTAAIGKFVAEQGIPAERDWVAPKDLSVPHRDLPSERLSDGSPNPVYKTVVERIARFNRETEGWESPRAKPQPKELPPQATSVDVAEVEKFKKALSGDGPLSWTLKTGAKITLFPYYVIGKTLSEVSSRSNEPLLKIPFRILKEDGVAIAGYLLLSAYNSTVPQLYLENVVGTDHDKLDPEEDYFVSKGGPVVGINGVEPREAFYDAADTMTGSALANDQTVFQSKAGDPGEMLEYLKSVYKKSGPIKKLVLAGHGAPGRTNIGGVDLSGNWVKAHPDLIASLPPDLFAKDAKVILLSCSTAQGTSLDPDLGVDSLKAVFTPLLKRGGTVIASTRYVQPNPRKIPSEHYDQGFGTKHFVLPWMGLTETMEYLGADSRSQGRKVVRIPIPATVSEKTE